MKTMVLGLALLGVSAIAARAQTTNQLEVAQLPKANVNVNRPVVIAVPPQPAALQRIFGPNATIGGVLPDLRRRQLWKRGPMKPGTEFDNVASHPTTGRSEGIILFSIKF
jgi:hypothetical protein